MGLLAHFTFELRVFGGKPHLTQAIAKLKTICREHLPERHEIEVGDLFGGPLRALGDRVLPTSVLVKDFPRLTRKIVPAQAAAAGFGFIRLIR